MSDYNILDIIRNSSLLSFLLKDSSSEVKKVLTDLKRDIDGLTISDMAMRTYAFTDPIKYISFLEEYITFEECKAEQWLKDDTARMESYKAAGIKTCSGNYNYKCPAYLERESKLNSIRAKIKSMTE